jgi:hypothetical protein
MLRDALLLLLIVPEIKSGEKTKDTKMGTKGLTMKETK